MLEQIGQQSQPQATAGPPGDFISPFDNSEVPPLSSSDEEELSDDGQLEQVVTGGYPSVGSALDSPSSANNCASMAEYDRYPTHPQSVVGEMEAVSVMSLSRVDFQATNIDDMVRELERVSLGSKGKDGRTSSDESESGDQSINWIGRLQVSYHHIGQGSYGRVFKVLLDGEPYALKVVEASRECQLRKIASEARASLLLKHENVVRSFKCCALRKGTGETGSQDQPLELWILQELCEGGTLDEAIRKPSVYPPGTDAESRERILTGLSIQIAKGLEYIHAHGHIHGDLSSNNVLLAFPPRDTNNQVTSHKTASGYTLADVTLKISDFGRSKEKGFNSCRTDSIGTVTFMPPETLTSGALKPSSDIYSYGILLMQLWTGKLPYTGYNFAQIIFEASQGRTPQLSEDADAPDVVKELIQQCLSPLSSSRPTATEILRRFSGEAIIRLHEADEADEH